jgi:hypothetical protein
MTTEEFRSGAHVRTALIRGNTFGYRAVQYFVSEDQALFEGDIVLGTVDQVEQATKEILDEMHERRAVAIRGGQYRWPGGIVPYTVDPALPEVERVHAAIRHWNERTNIWLLPRSGQHNYLTFKPGVGCASNVGMQGGEQFITLAPACDGGHVIHEIGHALGLWHEQSRKDRDLYIRILWQNIRPGMEHNFYQHISDGDDIGSYDYKSIMHYPTWAFSRNAQPTIVARDNEPIGQRDGLSQGDIAAINTLYPSTATGKLDAPSA